LDATIRALADPTRREILRMLRESDLAAGEIAARFDMTAPTVSHHLSVLKDAGLVQAERDGRSVVYSIDTTVVQEFLAEMMRFFGRGGER
jgi:DNA-binding transcriptional ArsR family regulator